MAVNKYGNDFKNNIMWNKEYPFIPEVTNDYGFTIHEGDIVDYYAIFYGKYKAARVYKIYNKDYVWTRIIDPENDLSDHITSANELFPYTSNTKIPPLEDYNNIGVYNSLRAFLSWIYSDLYSNELILPGEKTFNEDLYQAKRQEEVNRIKNKY